jgi:putative ABC transport system permease protein
VNAMHLKDPVGKTVRLYRKNLQVIGVVKNFHFESMHSEIKPSYLVLVPQRETIIASIKSNNQQATINAIQRLYESFRFPIHI